MADRKITIEVDGRESLIKHIEELQSIITRKNELIKTLQNENQELIKTPSAFIDRLRDEAWRQGWNACKKSVKTSLDSLERLLEKEDL